MQRINGTVIKTGVIAIALALAGCGGGGDSAPDAGGPVAEAPAQRTVKGTAAKGLIKGARVSLYAVDAQGVRAATALGTATTGADGTYSLQIASTVQNFVIEVTAAPGATMADEASGAELPLPADMKLRSVVTLAPNATGAYEGTVSPLTEMVARTAESADGKLTPQAVSQAKANVRTLLGFDPETVKPINSNNPAAASASEDEKNQSLALAAISQMGSTATADCGQSTPGERISCVVTKLASSVTIKDGQPALEQNRLSAFRDAIQAVAQDKKINRTGKDKVVGIPVFNPPATTPPPVATAPTPVAATKALFASLRTNLSALDEGDAFRKTADAIKADLNRDLVPLSKDVGGHLALSVNALEQLDRYRSGQTAAEMFYVSDYQLYESTYPSDYSNGMGNCRITKSPLSMTCTTGELDVLEQESGPTADGYTRTYVTRTMSFQPKAGTTNGFTYATLFEKRSITYTRGNVTVETAPRPITGTFSGEMSFARHADVIAEVAIKGRMPGRLNGEGKLLSTAEEWSLNATRTEEANGIALYQFGGDLSVITGGTATQPGQTAGKVEIDHSSFLRLAMAAGSNRVAVNPANELQVTLRGSVGTTAVDGTLNVSGDKLDKSQTLRMPTRLSFKGSLKHKDAAVFSGKVAISRDGYDNFDATAAESESNFVADTVEIGGSLSVPNRPVLSLTLGATRTGIDSANITAQYRDDTSVINASVSAKLGERYPLVKVSSADGVAFSFAGTAAPVKVTKDGAVTAEIDLGKGIITYADGSTESLK